MNVNGISGTDASADIQERMAASRGRFRAVHEAASTYLGISADELRTKLEGGQTLADVAQASGKSVDGLQQAIADAIKKSDPDADADKIAQRIVSTQPGQKGASGPNGAGFAAALGKAQGGPGPGSAPPFQAVQDAVNSYLGLSADDVRTKLEGGQTLAEVAEASGKSVDGLEQAIADAIKTNDPDADATTIAHQIASAQPSQKAPSGFSGTYSGTFATQLSSLTRGSEVSGSEAGSLQAYIDNLGSQSGNADMQQQLIASLMSSTGVAFRGIDDFA